MLQILLSVTLCRVLDSLVARYLKERDHVNAYVVQFATGTHTHQLQRGRADSHHQECDGLGDKTPASPT